MQKGFIKIIVIIVAIVIIGGLGYLVLIDDNTENPEESAVEDKTTDLSFKDLSTENWKAYKNEEYEFEYPLNWDIKENDFGWIVVDIIPPNIPDDKYFDFHIIKFRETDLNLDPERKASLKDLIGFGKGRLDIFQNYKIEEEKNIILVDKPAYKINANISMGIFGMTAKEMIYLVNNDGFYEIWFHASEDVFEDYSLLYKQILSTFKFID